MVKRALVFVLLLAACEPESMPYTWEDHLDPYMASQGYTIALDGETILKNDYPVWIDEHCVGRGCFGSNRPLVPSELAEGVRLDLLNATKTAQEEFVADVSNTIGIKPVKKLEPTNE